MQFEEYTLRVEVSGPEGYPAPFGFIRIETSSGPVCQVSYKPEKSDPYLIHYKLKRDLKYISLVLVDQTGKEERADIKVGTHRFRFAKEEESRAIDVVIVSIREDENSAILKRVLNYSPVSFKHRTYAVGSVDHNRGGKYAFAIVRTPEQGPGAAQDTTRDAIEDLNPKLIIVVGIAGAVPDNEFTLGDVVIASRLHDFTVGAVTEGRPTEYANQGGGNGQKGSRFNCVASCT